MESERFQKAKEIFLDAVDLPANERREFVAGRCEGDNVLLSEINELLDFHEGSEDPFETPAVASLVDFISDAPIPKYDGKQIGAYRIIREVGRGGMGAVYLANRIEGFHKQVAVKVIKRGLDTDDIVRRFEQERQILAALDHPNIARLIDGGAGEDGSPFLVMDYVEGSPITTYCAQGQTSTDEKLALFLQVCSAVAYAHQNLIVHRDIKPTNILVTPDGAVKLLDFGVAKLLGDDHGIGATVTHTLQAMTPEYASPEQLIGGRITTAADIYSLGVVLCELVAGERPEPVVSHPSNEGIGQRSRERTGKKTKFPKDDLGKIISMALREEPLRRYSSVEQFAADIRRYLSDLPVIAQTDSFSYRAEKFVRRNKGLVAVTVGGVASLIVGITATSRQAKIAKLQRDKAQKINEFLKKTLTAPDPRSAGKDIKFVEILSSVAHAVETDFADQPAIAADLQTTVGLTYLSLGIFDSAEKHLKNSLDVRLAHFPRQTVDVAVSLNNYGKLLQEKGDYSAAEPFYREAFRIMSRLGLERSLEFASILRNLGYLLAIKGEHDRAIGLHKQELAIRLNIQGENHSEVALTLSELGDVTRMMGRLDQAESLHSRALRILQKKYGAEHPDIALLMYNLGDSIYARKPREAETLYRQSLAMRRKLLGEDHADTAWSLYRLAYVLIYQENYAEAESYLGEIFAKRGVTLPESHLVINSSYIPLGWILMWKKQFAEARAAFEKCLDLRRQTWPADHWLLAMPSIFLGECLMYLGDTEKGKSLLFENYEILRKTLGDHHDLTQTARKKIDLFFR